MGKYVNLAGMKFGKLTAMERCESDKNGRPQ